MLRSDILPVHSSYKTLNNGKIFTPKFLGIVVRNLSSIKDKSFSIVYRFIRNKYTNKMFPFQNDIPHHRHEFNMQTTCKYVIVGYVEAIPYVSTRVVLLSTPLR